MPDTPNPVRTGLVNHLKAYTALTTLLGAGAQGVGHRRVSQAVKPPIVIVDKRSGVPAYSFDDDNPIQRDTWIVKGVAWGRQADRAEHIAALIDEALTTVPVAMTNRYVLSIYRESDVDYPEQVGTTNEVFQHCGGVYVVVTQRSA